MRSTLRLWKVGVLILALAVSSCEQVEKPAKPAETKAWEPSQPLLLFDVRSGKLEKTDAVVEAGVDLRELTRLYSISRSLALTDLKVSELDVKGGVLGDCVSQTEPSEDDPIKGVIVWRVSGSLPPNTVRHFGLFVGAQPASTATIPPSGVKLVDTAESITVENEYFRIVHPKNANGGLPSEIAFKDSGRIDKELRFNDRLHSKAIGGFNLRNDKEPVVRLIASGPIRTTISVTARYANEKGVWPESHPKATYRFSYSAGSPFVNVAAEVTQASAATWNELHFLELHHKKPFFPNWAVGEGPEIGAFKDTDQSTSSKNWGAIFGPKDALGLFTPGRVLIHDGASHYGTYLHGPWIHDWSDVRWSGAAKLYLGPSDGSLQLIAEMAEEMKEPPRVVVRAPILEAMLADAEKIMGEIETAKGAQDPDIALHRWRVGSLRSRAESGQQLADAKGAIEEEIAALQKIAREPSKPGEAAAAFAVEKKPDTFRVTNGTIGIAISTSGGLSVSGIYNGVTQCEMVAHGPQTPLWEIEFHNAEGKSAVLSPATKGFEHSVNCETSPDGEFALVRAVSRHADLGEEKDAVDVEATARLQKGSAFSVWRIKVMNRARTWGVWEARFPQIQPGGENGVTAYPSGWGVLLPLDGPPFSHQALYPSGSCVMQFGSFNAGESGLYYAAHDGAASTKKLAFSSDGASSSMRMGLGQYPEGMGVPAKNYEQPYDVLIGVFKGDWFTATKIYRAWALKQKWCSKGRMAERADVSPKIKNIALWALSGGAASDTIPGLLNFKQRFGVPLATHWYSWHVIPFDHTYPEYFPPKPGFKEGVKTATDAGVLVMPYINGRLWDVGIVSFVKEGLKYATRDEKGKAYIEVYGSKRLLAAMCPYTKLWQDRVGEIVWRLIDEFGVSGVYTDQVAAAAPRLCLDASHGHPLGGGSWWVEGYDKMLTALRARIKSKHPDSFLTTESNAEPYIQHYDAYLMCNSTQGNLIPMFSSVYSDMILTFGRYTFEGDAKDENAFYMKEGQLFIFGGQLGWIGYFPADPKYKEQGDYLKALSECRARTQKFMALGEMLPPLELRDPSTSSGQVPKVVGQWAVWRTKQKIELPAVMNSVWKAPDGAIGIALTNMSAQPVAASFAIDLSRYGLAGTKRLVSELSEKGWRDIGTSYTSIYTRSEHMPPRSVRFLAITPK